MKPPQPHHFDVLGSCPGDSMASICPYKGPEASFPIVAVIGIDGQVWYREGRRTTFVHSEHLTALVKRP